jgi:Sulfotransferase domain
MNYFFITGLYRSGTTLLQKILQNHPKFFSVDQPIPNLYSFLKTVFYDKKDIVEDNVLGTLFNNSKYELSEFTNFIDNYTINDFKKILEQAQEFSGVKSDKIFKIFNELYPDTLVNVYSQICDSLSSEYKKSQADYKGTKEIIAEEYIPYFLNKDIKVLLIIRDIRDVINSTLMGRGSDFIGDVRPTMFNIRNWRKSVAYSIAFKKDPNFLTIKYEDLVLDTESTLSKISDFFNADGFDIDFLNNGLKDHSLEDWKGNSSFNEYSGISNKSIGNYKNNFDIEYINYIEKLCLPELLYLKYEVNNLSLEKMSFLEEFVEPFQVNHKYFHKNYSNESENIELEKNRINYLLGNKEVNKNKYFIFDEVADVLKKEIDGR